MSNEKISDASLPFLDAFLIDPIYNLDNLMIKGKGIPKTKNKEFLILNFPYNKGTTPTDRQPMRRVLNCHPFRRQHPWYCSNVRNSLAITRTQQIARNILYAFLGNHCTSRAQVASISRRSYRPVIGL